jgi:hypothetical protein
MTTRGSAGRASTRALLAMAALGALLLLRYATFDAGLVRGAAEFDYHTDALGPLPFAPMLGFTRDQLARHVARLLLLGPALVLLTLPVEALLGGAFPDTTRLRRLTWMGIALSLVFTGWVMFGVFGGRAIIDDELAYKLQARLLLDGRLGDPAGASWPFPSTPATIWTPVGATGKYLFGEPIVQMVGTLVGIPALLHLPVAALTLLAFRRAVRGATDARVADWATLLVALSPMFVLTTATGLSHTTSLACLAFAALGLQWVRERCASGGRTAGAALLVGGALGFGLTARIQTVGPGGAWLGIATLVALVRTRRWGSTAVLLGGVAAFAGAIGAYDTVVTGAPFTLPWMRFLPVEHLGFGPVWEAQDTYTHTPLAALSNLLVTAVRFNGWWLGWPASLALLGVWAAVGRPRAGAGPYLAMAAGIITFQLFYYSPGVSDTGPVYYYELLLPAAVLGAHAIVAAGERWPGLTGAALAVHLVLGTGSFLGEHVARLDRLVSVIHAPADDLLSRIRPPALLLVETRPGELRGDGWLWGGFPVWDRGVNDPIVEYPRESAANAAALRDRFSGRACWYYRRNPTTGRPEFGPCDRNGAFVDRD